MVLSYDFYKGFWLINDLLSKEKFLEIVGCKSGYAVDMFSRIYESIFSELIDVEREYSKYYSYEYETFSHFLYKKYNIDVEDIEYLLEERQKYPHCKIFKKDDFSYGDNSTSQFITSETMSDRFGNILKMKI